MSLNQHTFSIASVTEAVQVMEQSELEKNQNKLFINLAPEIETMYADESKVRQILLNILHNAAKFTHNGSISLHVQQNSANPAHILFVITDSGIGMTQLQIDQLFRPFFQADLSTTRRYGGTGLGLAISYHLCQLMQGDIFVESKLHKGSIFSVSLPVTVEALPETAPNTVPM